MGQINHHRPVLRIAALFSGDPEALAWARQRMVQSWGNLLFESPLFEFTQTEFYAATMGPDLKKQLLAFQPLIDPLQLVDSKHQSNQWELQYAQTAASEFMRPLNIDPGYLTEAKLVLATTKDRDHRLYLDRGIYAEGTLFFHRGAWQSRPWTYPDYQLPEYHAFFTRCRNHLRDRYRSSHRSEQMGGSHSSPE